MSIPDEVIEEVRQRGDLVEIVSEHTNLRRSGRTFRGPCPLHGGEGPNFSVDPERNLFKCFVCGEGGDIFAFPMKHLGLDFLSAVRLVAERAGVEIPEERPGEREEDPRAPLFEVNAFAADWFSRQLRSEEGARVRGYLKERGISPEDTERFGLGWAPDRWDGLREAAAAHDISPETLVELGLAKESRKGGAPYDAFRGRLIFPIHDLGGRVLAFGGRILTGEDPSVPKYINSPETPLYHKGEVLYGLNLSRGPIRREGRSLVVEGYMDFVSLAAHGVENAVAPLGTAMTPEQAELVGRYAPEAVLLYDSDTAGLKATFRTADALLRVGVGVRVATLPEGEDPDSVVRAGGAEALRPYISDAVDVLERKIQILERKDYFGSIAGTRRAIDALLPTVRAARDEVLREVYLKRIAEKTGVTMETLTSEAGRVSDHEPRARPRPHQPRSEPPREAQAERPASVGAERNLLMILLRDEAYVERAARELSPRDFRDRTYREIYDGLLHLEGMRDPGGEWLEAFPDDVRPRVEEILRDEEGGELASVETFFNDNLRRLLLRSYEERLAEIDRQLAAAEGEEAHVLWRKRDELRKELREKGLAGRWGVLGASDI